MAKKRKSRSREADILYRTFGDLEVVDATDDLRVIANDDDVKSCDKERPQQLCLCGCLQAAVRGQHRAVPPIRRVCRSPGRKWRSPHQPFYD